MFETVIVREIGFIVIFVVTIIVVAWYLPKLSPTVFSFGITRAKKQNITPHRVKHDGVLWEDGGSDSWGNVNVVGPLCPKDYTPLSTKHNDKIEAYLSFDTLISSSNYHSRLICLECHAKYTLGRKPKKISDSRNEIAVRFTGMRKLAREN